jgi:hypothetical protein
LDDLFVTVSDACLVTGFPQNPRVSLKLCPQRGKRRVYHIAVGSIGGNQYRPDGVSIVLAGPLSLYGGDVAGDGVFGLVARERGENGRAAGAKQTATAAVLATVAGVGVCRARSRL